MTHSIKGTVRPPLFCSYLLKHICTISHILNLRKNNPQGVKLTGKKMTMYYKINYI